MGDSWAYLFDDCSYNMNFKKCISDRCIYTRCMAPIIIAIMRVCQLLTSDDCVFIGYLSEVVTLYWRTKLVCLWLSFMSLASSIWLD